MLLRVNTLREITHTHAVHRHTHTHTYTPYLLSHPCHQMLLAHRDHPNNRTGVEMVSTQTQTEHQRGQCLGQNPRHIQWPSNTQWLTATPGNPFTPFGPLLPSSPCGQFHTPVSLYWHNYPWWVGEWVRVRAHMCVPHALYAHAYLDTCWPNFTSVTTIACFTLCMWCMCIHVVTNVNACHMCCDKCQHLLR